MSTIQTSIIQLNILVSLDMYDVTYAKRYIYGCYNYKT